MFKIYMIAWGLGRDAACDCGTPWTFLSIFGLLQINTERSLSRNKTEKKKMQQELHN